MARVCFSSHGDRFRCSRDGFTRTTRREGAKEEEEVGERRGPMFISWAVRSYQSNGAECDFSQGISVCLIEILYPIQLASFVASPPSPSFGFPVVSPCALFQFSLFSNPLFFSPARTRVHTSVLSRCLSLLSGEGSQE